MQPTNFTCDRCHAPLTPGTQVCQNCGQQFATPVPYPQAPGYITPSTPKKGMPALAIVAIVGGVGCLPIIAIFAAILFPVFAKVREKARETSSMSNLKQIGLATLQFENDHNNKYPPTDSVQDFKDALNPYLGQTRVATIFIEPGTMSEYTINPAISNEDAASAGDPAQVEIAREPVPHGGRYTAVLYGDGHVSMLDATMGGTSSDGGTSTSP
jgi:prepilin-type processing-associated H-X9-DG protein